MAHHTTTRLYDTYAQASGVVTALEQAGIPHADISLIGRDGQNGHATPDHGATGTTTEPQAEKMQGTEKGAGTGASVGTLVGGGVGLLAGIGALAIPGVGPVVAAGWLIATLTGAGVGAAVGGGAGGLVGMLTGAGVPENDAHVYAEGVRRGGAIVSVRTEETMVPTVERILASHPGVDTASRRGEYEAGGWSRHDEAADPYVPTPTTTPRADLR